MTQPQIEAFYQLCDSLDIRKFTFEELNRGFSLLRREILIGLKRKGERESRDGGLEAIDTAVKPLNPEDFKKVPEGTKVLYGAYAGTNWITGVAVKLGDTIVEEKLVTKSFLRLKDRQFLSREAFAAMVAKEIEKAFSVLNGDKIASLAVSYGFPQIPKTNSYGRDALITCDHLTKSWYIKNGTGMLVGKYVLEELKKKRINCLQKVYFANDTTAVCLDISAKNASLAASKSVSLPLGFVMGTGDNASALFKGYKNGNLVNLEIGSAQSLGSDRILDEMIRLNLTPQPTPVLEYFMGGDYLLSRLACSLKLLQERCVVKNDFFTALLRYAKGAKITSRLAARDVTALELSELLHLKVKANDLFVLNEVARRMIVRGGQVAGIMVSAVCELAGWSKGVKGAIPVEGTVFSQGFGFRESIRKTMKILIPDHQLVFVPGSGTRGIATEAMIREYLNS